MASLGQSELGDPEGPAGQDYAQPPPHGITGVVQLAPGFGAAPNFGLPGPAGPGPQQPPGQAPPSEVLTREEVIRIVNG